MSTPAVRSGYRREACSRESIFKVRWFCGNPCFGVRRLGKQPEVGATVSGTVDAL